MSWAVHESGPAVVLRITGVRAVRLTPEEARALAVALLVSAEGFTQMEPVLASSAPALSTTLDKISIRSHLEP